MFEALFKEVYGLNECNLRDYFDEVMIRQSPKYAYGETERLWNPGTDT